MKEQLSKIALFNFFSGQSSPLQKRLIEEWLDNPANVEKYYEWLEEWEQKYPQYIPDTEKGLRKFFTELHSSDMPTPLKSRSEPTKTSRFRWIAYAASVLLFVSISANINLDFITYETFSTDYAEIRELVLPDGSAVTLNSNSVLRVPRFGFGKETRNVFLSGEAEFSVVHTKDDEKFLVHTPDHLEVEVVGTEFIVYSRARGSKVVLNKGKILLRSLSDTTKETLTIRPGDVVTVRKGAFRVQGKQVVQEHSAWKEHRFVFDHTPLQEVACQVEESFGLKMHISDSLLAKRELTGTYEAVNAEDLFDVLTRVFDLEMKQTGKKVVVNLRQE